MYRLTAVFLDEDAANWAAHLLRKISDVLSVTVEEIKMVELQHMPANFLATAEILAPTEKTKESLPMLPDGRKL